MATARCTMRKMALGTAELQRNSQTHEHAARSSWLACRTQQLAGLPRLLQLRCIDRSRMLPT